MRARAIDRTPIRSEPLYGLSLASLLLCIALWMRAKTIGEDERGNAERRAIFIGLWPPMFWLIGDTLRRSEERTRHNRCSFQGRSAGGMWWLPSKRSLGS